MPASVQRRRKVPTWSKRITAGLLAYWAFDENTGTTAKDSSGKGMSGTYNGTTASTSVPSAIKFPDPYCRSFNGTTGWVGVTPQVGYSGPFTISAWVNPASNTVAQFLTIMSSLAGGNNRVLLSLWNGSNIYLAVGNGASFPLNNQTAGTLAYQTGVWYHIAAVVTNTTYAIYVNGASVGSGSFSSMTPLVYDTAANGLRIGEQSGGSRLFNGSLDDVRIYGRALSASEVVRIASGVG